MDLFIVISGFVVLLSAWDRRPRAFVVSRIVRLYPAFWIAVTVVVVMPASMPTAGITAVSSRFTPTGKPRNQRHQVTNLHK
ncbi:hypothetical protein [Micromonospora inositola]|uniref:hypothetical protein n=1 Tax=Micromonospora inositola TaxID=47865 RepID=UPI000B5ADF62|nr:hypothetical protein [Micromonospora inositola]